MGVLSWVVLATLVAFAVAAVAVRTAVPPLARGTQAGGGKEADAGMAPLQRLAVACLAIALAMAIPYAVVQVAYGPERVAATAAIRLPISAVLVVGFIAYGTLLAVTRRRIRKGRVILDERDEAILARAPRAQVGAMLVGLAAWMLGAVEGFQEAGQLPLAFLYPLFWSIVLLAVVALPIGILAGYWGE